MSNPLIPDEILDKPIEDLIYESVETYNPSLHTRLLNAMRYGTEEPIVTVRDLLRCHRSTFTLMPNFGKKCMRELDRILEKFSLTLPQRKDDSATYCGLPVPQSDLPDPIYLMELHKIYEINSNLTALRVPGGWIYSIFDTDAERHTCFVPEVK